MTRISRTGFATASAVAALSLVFTTGCSTKNYVRSQTEPVIQKTNELDDATAANNRAIHDVDSRSQAGIQQAQNSATQAQQNAQNANTAATTAQSSAQDAVNRADSLAGVISNLDNYKQVGDVSVTFGFNKSVLTKADKDQLDQFGGQLDIDAPAVIASFGTGNASIDVRWVYSGGASQYDTDLPAMLSQRKAFDAQLLTNSRVEFSPTARAQLRSGQVDPWLPDLIAIMAHSYPLSIVDFRSQSPGGGPASLMRWMDLATNVPSAHLTRAAYLNGIRSFLDAQLSEYHPDWVRQVTLPSGHIVLRVGFGAPSPLNPQS